MEPTKPPDDAQVLLLEEVAYILRISVASVRCLVWLENSSHSLST
jgi:hypothetical protein